MKNKKELMFTCSGVVVVIAGLITFFTVPVVNTQDETTLVSKSRQNKANAYISSKDL